MVNRSLLDITNTYGDMHSIIYATITLPLTSLGGNIWAMIIAIFAAHLLWVVGVHGMLIVVSVLSPILQVLTNENLAAHNVGEAIPHTISGTLLGMVVFMGSGATLGLVILMFRAKSERYRALAKLAFIPNAVGINEPVIFGLPIVMNFTLAIPFILMPIIILILAYLGMISGILPLLPGFTAPLGTPVVIGGFLMGGWRWALFQALMIVLSVAIYYPFFRRLDKAAYEEELKAQ